MLDSAAKSFLKHFTAARKNLSTYPDGHDMPKQSLEALKKSFQPFLNQNQNLRIENFKDCLSIGDVKVFDDVSAVRGLIKEFSERRFRSLTFYPQVSIQELTAFLKLMSQPPNEIALRGGYLEIFRMLDIRHIQIELLKSASVEKEIIVNGQSLDLKMLQDLMHPELVKDLLEKLVSSENQDKEIAQTDLPLEETLKNIDEMVNGEILKGVPSHKVIDTLITSEGFARFRMFEGESGLEKKIYEKIDNINLVEEKILFLVELMRTSQADDRYQAMTVDFVEQLNALVTRSSHTQLLSSLMIFMLEERRNERRYKVFNESMKNLNLDQMVNFVLTNMDRRGNFEEVILGTMIRSFGQSVAELVIGHYLSTDDQWQKETTFAALIHGSRYAFKAMMTQPKEVLSQSMQRLVFLAVSMPEGQHFLDHMLKGDDDFREKFYWSLGKANDSRVLPWLKNALKEDNAQLRKTALSQLENLDCDESIDLLIDHLKISRADKDKKKYVDEICLIINALARLKAHKAMPLLQEISRQRTWFFDGDGKMIKSYARFALGKIVS